MTATVSISSRGCLRQKCKTIVRFDTDASRYRFRYQSHVLIFAPPAPHLALGYASFILHHLVRWQLRPMLPSGSQLNAPAVHSTHFLCSILFQSFRPILALSMESNCQSSFQHGPRDLQSHYFGCLKTSEREAFLKRLPERNRVRIRDEEHRIARLRSIFKTREDIEEGVLFRRHTLSLRRWRATQVKANPQSYQSSAATATKNSTDGSDDGEGQSGSRRGSHRIPHLRTYIDEGDDDVDIFANMIFFKDVSAFLKTCPT